MGKLAGLWSAIKGGETLSGAVRAGRIATVAKDMTKFHKGQLFGAALNFALPVLTTMHEPRGERLKHIGQSWAVGALTLGYRSNITAAIMANLIFAAFDSPAIGRGVVQGMRTGIHNRTMAAVPFSMTQVNTQQAYAAMDYARQRMGSAYSSFGSEAAVFSAKYLQR